MNREKKEVAVKNEKGATMLEYGVMVALILAICIATVKLIGTNISGSFSTVNSSMN